MLTERVIVNEEKTEEIINTISYPKKVLKRGELYYARKNIGRATIEVVYEKDKYINVVTVYYL